MDPLTTPSFMPKKPVAADPRVRSGGTSLLSLIAILIFVAALVAAGGAFAYKHYLNGALTSKSQQLQKAKEAYGPEAINDLMRLNTRLNSGQKILATHLAPSGVFAFLSAQTLEQVQFTSFDLDLAAEGGAKISLAGIANSFSTIALQSDQFGGSKVLHDVIFSDIVISPETGKVAFSVDATVEPSLLLYSQNFGTATPAPAPAQVSIPAATSTLATSSSQQL